MIHVLAILGTSVVAIAATGDPAGVGVDYARDVKPLLQRRCYACHGVLKQKGGLRLDTVASMREGGDGGPAVEPGQAAESYLIEAVTGDAGFRMPPEGEPLSDAEIGTLRAWIDGGAAAPSDDAPQQDPARHWAFVPPVRPAVPTVAADPAWSINPIDAFLAAEHDRRGLAHAPAADPATLLRRVSLDLTGLAPTPEELEAFAQDSSPSNYDNLVDRLLASPHYGERWGRHWMDVWRYSDWAGYGAEVRESRPHIWRWRDWIVESLNSDIGYDRMVVAMLAGDEAAPDDPRTIRATGYLARNWYKFSRDVWLQNTVDHTAKAFLGITLACARCHDHKYDPIAQKDWYRFRAVFEPYDIAADRIPGQPDTSKDSLARVYDANPEAPTYLYIRGSEKQPETDHPLTPGVPKVLGESLAVEPVALPPTAYYPGLRPYIRNEAMTAAETAVLAARTALDAARKAADAARDAAAERASRIEDAADLPAARAAEARTAADQTAAERTVAAAIAGLESVKARIAADDAKFAAPPDSKRAEILALAATHAERQAKLLQAQSEQAHAQAAAAAAPTGDDPKARQARQQAAARIDAATKALAEARKIADGPHSMAYTPFVPPRPAVSTGRRLALARWIVDRGNPLAARVAVNHVWMRHFGAPLVPTVFDFGLNGRPPSHPALLDWLAVELMENGWSLKHLHRLIVTSQAYRMRSWAPADDPSARTDPANLALWRMNPRRMEAELVRDNVLYVAGMLDPRSGGAEIDQDQGQTVPRRSLYFRHAPEKQMTFLKLFDAANMSACYRRDESVMPQQALALANSPLALGAARTLAARLAAETHAENARFVAAAFQRVLGRAPSGDEADACAAYLAEQTRKLAASGSLTPFADAPAAAVPPAAEAAQRAREDLVHVLLNHNDFVTIR